MAQKKPKDKGENQFTGGDALDDEERKNLEQLRQTIHVYVLSGQVFLISIQF
jgi:hypothetical protein